ncbi:T9SS type A sorting domain-containing protein [uncultured Dokdonia sp.]|uniref:T9SS type A sorting domain-containing protein n=1 Tax=uncultured Dokdonia sp. TaxID=575653 RepID=UPI0026236E3D|nr:T9SS type A sorting domain-containing protein [uncultured Dokdonia sp.]
MKKITLLTILFQTILSVAQTVDIPDENFKNALLNQTPVIDSNNDGEIQVTEAEATTMIVVFDSNISDLTGIAAFISLEFLQASFNSISELDTSFFPNLETVSIASNDLQNLDFSENPNLVTIIASNNPLTSLDISNNTNLTVLNLNETLLQTIDVQNNTLLELIRIADATTETLDITTLSALNTLEISGSNITTIDLSQNENLLTLQANNLALNTIDISNNPLLEILTVAGTSVATIDFSANENLRLLNISNTLFSELNPFVLPDLQFIDFSQTDIQDIDFSSNTALCNVFALSDKLETVNLQNGANEAFENGGNCSVSAGFTSFSTPSEVFLMGNALASVCVDNIQFAEENFLVSTSAEFIEDCQLATDSNVFIDLAVYPNPTSDFVTIESRMPISSVTIHNALGQRVGIFENLINEKTIDISSYDSGIYFMTITSNTISEVKQLLKK